MTRRLAIICNPTAGGGRAARALDAVVGRLSGNGIELRVERSQSGEHAGRLARAAAEAGEEVVAFGGDGMVRIVAHAARGTDAAVGILPGGRGNDFARALGIPSDPIEACEVLLDGARRRVDAGDVGGETFVGIASVGIESEVTKIANALPRAFGQASYLIATFAGLARWKPATFALTIDGVERDFTGFIVGAANSPCFGGGMRFAPDAKLDDGLLDVVVVEQGPRALFALKAPKMFKGTHVEDPRVHVFRGAEVGFRTDRTFEVYADGDAIATTPATARAVPGALEILAPRR